MISLSTPNLTHSISLPSEPPSWNHCQMWGRLASGGPEQRPLWTAAPRGRSGFWLHPDNRNQSQCSTNPQSRASAHTQVLVLKHLKLFQGQGLIKGHSYSHCRNLSRLQTSAPTFNSSLPSSSTCPTWALSEMHLDPRHQHFQLSAFHTREP